MEVFMKVKLIALFLGLLFSTVFVEARRGFGGRGFGGWGGGFGGWGGGFGGWGGGFGGWGGGYYGSPWGYGGYYGSPYGYGGGWGRGGFGIGFGF